MYCRECGKEIADNSEFCGHCGAAQGGAAQEGQPPAPPGPQAYAPQPGPAGTSPQGAGPKKSVLPWVLGGIGVLAVIAIVLVLVFVVFGGDGAGDTSGPEQVVKDYYEALGQKDVDMLIATMEPSFRSELEDTLGKNYDQYLEDYFFAYFPEDLEYAGYELETEIDGDEATVEVIGGTVTYIDEEGDKVSEEAPEGESEAVQLVRVDGKWYLSGDYLRESGFDPEELEKLQGTGIDLEDAIEDLESTGADGSADEEEMAEVEEAMLEYAQENSAEGCEFAITGLLINGDEAIGIAVCTSMELDNAPVVMQKDSGGWYGVEFSTDIEFPAWFEDEMAEAEEAALASLEENVAVGQEVELQGFLVRGDEAVGVVVNTGQELENAMLFMKKGSSGWYLVDFGTDIEIPSWYEPNLEAWFM